MTAAVGTVPFCTACRSHPRWLAGPWRGTGDAAAPVFLLAQNPPQRLETARPGAFRLHVHRHTNAGRLEKAVDGLLSALGLSPGAVFATQTFKCATRGNVVPPELVRRCRPHLRAELAASGADLFLCLGKVSTAAFFAHVHRSRVRGRTRMPVRGGVSQKYDATLHEVRLRTDGRPAWALELPHPATAVRFILPGAWERTAADLVNAIPHALSNERRAFPRLSRAG